jgi:hypothetical protein
MCPHLFHSHLFFPSTRWISWRHTNYKMNHTSTVFRCVHKIAKSNYWLRHVCLATWSNLASTGQVLMKFDIRDFFKNLSEKIQVLLKSDKNNGYFTWRVFLHLWYYSAEFILEWYIFQVKAVEKIKIYTFYIQYPFSQHRAVYEIMSKNVVEPERLQMPIWWHVSCMISKATLTQSHAHALTHRHTYVLTGRYM